MTSQRAAPQHIFDERYLEDVTLDDGTRVCLRLVRPEDKALLLAGFHALSPESRYRRFLGGKSKLSPRELAYLTEFDGERHLAIGATLADPEGAKTGLGVARFVRAPNDPTVAEPAVAVIDAYQSRGLGRILMQRLAEAARERGVNRFRCVVLTDNPPVRAMLESIHPRIVQSPEDDVMQVEFDLTVPPGSEQKPEQDASHGLRGLLRAVAAGLASVRLHRAHEPDAAGEPEQ